MADFLSSAYGLALQVVVGWTVLDAVMTAAIALKVGKFELRSFSLFLEKIGSEALGVAVLGALAFYGPLQVALAPMFAVAFGVFVASEGAGVKDKVEELFASFKGEIGG